MLVDNATYMNGSGQIQNLANDGSSSDVIVSAPHAASQEWAGVQASSVVIYELDAPIVADKVASDSLSVLGSQVLSSLFTATDPASKAITEWQIYDTASNDTLVSNGTDYQDHTASSALTVASLSAVSLLAGATKTTDMLNVRAYNGSYWGDWTLLTVSVLSTALPSPPVLASQTSAQSWLGGKSVTLALPASTFTDPQGEKLTYVAALSNGNALPGWLVFNAATETFSGTAPAAAQTLDVVVTATDTSGLSATDSFLASVLGAPVLAAATPNQTWTEGKPISLVLSAGTFTDPQSESLVYTATQSNGQALPSWLSFNATTETFSGTASATAQTLGITVTATDRSGLSSSESFSANVQPSTPVVKPAITVSAQTPDQTWMDGQAANLVLPANTFTDALGLKMTFAAYEVSGPNVTSWLHFNSATDDLYGTVPTTAIGTVRVEVIATDAQHVTASDLFNVTLVAASGHTTSSLQLGAVPSSTLAQTTGVLAFCT